jgi:hypothetical protein
LEKETEIEKNHRLAKEKEIKIKQTIVYYLF